MIFAELVNLLLIIALPTIAKGVQMIWGQGIISPFAGFKELLLASIILVPIVITANEIPRIVFTVLVIFAIFAVAIWLFRASKFTIEAFQVEYPKAEYAVESWLAEENLAFEKNVQEPGRITYYDVQHEPPFQMMIEERDLFTSKKDKRTLIDINREGRTNPLGKHAEELTVHLRETVPAYSPFSRALWFIIPGFIMMLPSAFFLFFV